MLERFTIRTFNPNAIKDCAIGNGVEVTFWGKEKGADMFPTPDYRWVTFTKVQPNLWKITKIWNTKTDQIEDIAPYEEKTFTDADIQSFHKYHNYYISVPAIDKDGTPLMVRHKLNNSLCEDDKTYRLTDMLEKMDKTRDSYLKASYDSDNDLLINIIHNGYLYYTYIGGMTYQEFNDKYGWYISSFNVYL